MAFYKLENDLLEAPNFVIFPDGTELYAEHKDTYTYPIYDWYWFDDENSARLYFNLPLITEEE